MPAYNVGDMVRLSDGMTIGVVIRACPNSYELFCNGFTLFVIDAQIKRVISRARNI